MRKRMHNKLFSCCACCGGGATRRRSPGEDSDDETDARRATASHAPLPRPPALSISATPSSIRASTTADTDRSRTAGDRGTKSSGASSTELASATPLGPVLRRPLPPTGGQPFDLPNERRGHGQRVSSAAASPSASSVARLRPSIAQLFLQPRSEAAFSAPTRPRHMQLSPATSQLSPARVSANAKLWNEHNADGLASTPSPVASSASASVRSHHRVLLPRASPSAAASAPSPSRSSLASLPSQSTSLSHSQASVGRVGERERERVDAEFAKPAFSLLAAHRLRQARPEARPYVHLRRARRQSCAQPMFLGPATDADSDIDADPSSACVTIFSAARNRISYDYHCFSSLV